MVSGLKVNFQKSCLYGINVEDTFLRAGSDFLCCNRGFIPFMYLGLPIGANQMISSTWKPMVEFMRKRLSRWKGRNLTLGG